MLKQAQSSMIWPNSLWHDTVESRPSNPQLVGSIFADVAIIGAGFTGIRTAVTLAEAGLKVAILDAQDVGWGASGRNGGQVNPMLPFNSPERVRKLVGEDYFERLTHASLNSADELFEFIERYQIRCDARQKGWLRVLHSAGARKDAERDLKSWNRFGAGLDLFEGESVERLSGSRRYDMAVFAPRGGAVQPFKLVCGLAEIAKSAGAQIFGQSAVRSIAKVSGKWICKTDRGSVSSDYLVVATNGYTDQLVPGLAKSIIPLNPIQIATAPLPEDQIRSILPDGQTISDSRRVIMYARREPDNRIVYGGLGKSHADGTLSGFDWLRRDAEQVYPQLRGAQWSYEWGGTIAITDDHLPHIHEPASKCLVGLGYNGRGVAMSFVVGRAMAERILGAEPQELPIPTTDISKVPLRSLKLFGMDTAIRIMRLLDRMEAR